MTGSQSASSNNSSIQLDGSPLALNNALTFNASAEQQEIELKPGESIVITITPGGTGSVMLGGAVGIGVGA